MASNNLSIGAYALLHNGAILTKQSIQIAKDAEARDVLDVLNEFRQKRLDDDTTSIHSVRVFSPTRPDIHGRYHACDGTNEIPEGFKLVCVQNKWNVETTWQGLNGGHDLVWFKHAENDAYVYRNSQDGCWWIDGPGRPRVGKRWTARRTNRRWRYFGGVFPRRCSGDRKAVARNGNKTCINMMCVSSWRRKINRQPVNAANSDGSLDCSFG